MLGAVTCELWPSARWSAFLTPYSLRNEVSSHCLREAQELTEAPLVGTQWVC